MEDIYPCLADRSTSFPCCMQAPFLCCMQTLASHLLSVKEQVVSNEGLVSVIRIKSLPTAFHWKAMRLVDKPFFLFIWGPHMSLSYFP